MSVCAMNSSIPARALLLVAALVAGPAPAPGAGAGNVLPEEMAPGDLGNGAGFSWRVDFAKGWPVLRHNFPGLPLETYRGACQPVLTVALADGPAPRPRLGGGWAHQRADYAGPGPLKASLTVTRLSPAVLIETSGTKVILRPAAPWRHAAFARGPDSRCVVVPAAKLAGERFADLSEPWLLLWFGRGSPLRGWPEPFDVEDERGVSKPRLTADPPAVDLPVLVRLEHRPATIAAGAGGELTLTFAGPAGKVAILPVFGGRVVLPDESAGWSAGLPLEVGGVREACWLWGEMLRDVPVAVRETFAVDANEGCVTLREAFTWASFADDWKRPPVRIAPVPPMLAVARYGSGGGMSFRRGEKSVRPTPYLMDTPGLATGIEGGDYEIRFAGLRALIDPPRPAPGEPPPAAKPYRDKLARHVRQMIDAGPLRPLLYIYGGIGGTWFSHYYWSRTSELAVALAEASGHLPPALRAEAVAYLKAEWARQPALTFDPRRYRQGASRAPYEMPWQEMRQAAYALKREQAARTADYFHELYGVEAYLRLTGEKPPADLKDRAAELAAELLRRQDWAILGPGRLRDVRDRHGLLYYNLQGAATYNRWLAGAIGLTRLARRFGWKDLEPIGWYLTAKLAAARVAHARYVSAMHGWGLVRGPWEDDNRTLLHVDATCAVVGRGPVETGVHQNQETPPFYDLVPEVGRLLGRTARLESMIYLSHLDRSLPLWWIAEAPKQQATEHRTSPLQQYGGNVLAQYWVLGKTGRAFTRYVDTTRFVGDLYYLRNLAAAIESFRPQRSKPGGGAPRAPNAPNPAPLRGIGVNYFDAFYRTLKDPNDTSYDEGFRTLGRMGIPFARLLCGGFWPAENRLYSADRERYFRLLDGVVRSAETHGVGLVPSLFWHRSTVPDLVGEPCDQWGDPNSKTHAFLRTYVREVVTRYRDSPAVWAWEFGNEYNLSADLPNAAKHRPQVVVKLGTPATRSARDELTRDMIRTAFLAFAREVRRHDPRRAITTGNSLPRPSAWHQRAEGSWKPDTREQFAEILLGDHPDPLSAISVHVYRTPERLDWAAGAARQAGKILFVGEFGVPGKPTAETRKRFAELLGAVERSGAPLAALWVYDFARQTEWNVTADNERAWQLEAIAQANRRLRRARAASPDNAEQPQRSQR